MFANCLQIFEGKDFVKMKNYQLCQQHYASSLIPGGLRNQRNILLNPDFAVEIVMRVSNTRQIGVSGYFVAEEIVIYFKIKKCSEMLSCAAVGSRNRFSTAKSGFKNV